MSNVYNAKNVQGSSIQKILKNQEADQHTM